MMLSDVKNALLAVLPTKTYHHFAPVGTVAPYIVWAEDSQGGGLHGDGIMINQVIEGTIDLFSKTPDDPMIKQIQTALNTAGIGFRMNSVQFEPTTKIIHTEWVFYIEMDVI